MNLKERISKQLSIRIENQSFRELSVRKNLIDFASNDYLGLARSEELYKLIHARAKNIRLNGATGSRLLSGNSAYNEQVEQKLASTFKAEATLIFNSGYTANLAVLATLPQRGDTILYDELAHASIKDGARMSLAKRHSFRHNNLSDLENKLKGAEGEIFIVIEAAYSMDGDFCPLSEMVALSKKYNAHIILDEAHTTGILGFGGSGLSRDLGLEEQILARIYTFGKAMGIHGAAVACNKEIADYFINFARPFIYTTALAPHSLAAIEGAFDYLSTHEKLQEQLQERIAYFNRMYDSKIGAGLTKISYNHPIQAIIIPGNDAVKKTSSHLLASGYDVRPILSPTVKAGEERLRICLHTFNTDDDISGLIDSLAAVK